jgi:hypothetical protein
VEHLTYIDTACGKILARRRNVRDDQVHAWAEPGAAAVILVPN